MTADEYIGDDPVSRRDFLRGGLGGLAGAAALTAGLTDAEAVAAALAEGLTGQGGPGGPRDPEAVAAQLAGRRPADVRSVGLEPGRVRLAFNENPLGASPAAIESRAEAPGLE